MSEAKALVLAGAGTVLLSGVVDILLLKMHAGGAALAVGLVVVLALFSVVTNFVMRRYETLSRRRQREATLLKPRS
jgi:hypothetical protein